MHNYDLLCDNFFFVCLDEDGKDTTQPLWEEIWLDSTPGKFY